MSQSPRLLLKHRLQLMFSGAMILGVAMITGSGDLETLNVLAGAFGFFLIYFSVFGAII